MSRYPAKTTAKSAFRDLSRGGMGAIEVDIEVNASIMGADGRVDDLRLEVGGELYALSGVDYASPLSDIEDGIDIILQVDIPSGCSTNKARLHWWCS